MADLPQRLRVFMEAVEVVGREIAGWCRIEMQLCLACSKSNQTLKGVQCQPIVPIVGHVCHEHGHL